MTRTISHMMTVAILFAFLTAPSVLMAAWSSDPSVNTPVAVTPETEGSHKIVGDGECGYFVVWQHVRDDIYGNHDIYAQHFNGNGDPVWGTDGVQITDLQSDQAYPKVTPDGRGGIIVSWQDTRNDGSDIYAQRLDGDGNPQWQANGVPVIAATSYDGCGWIASDGAGGAIIMSYEGYVNRVDAGGNLPWAPADSPVQYSPSGDSWAPKIMSDGSGGAFLAWVEDEDAAMQRVDAGGNLLWNSGLPLMLTNHDSVGCIRIISDGAGGAIVAWESYDDSDVRAQRVSRSGTIQWTTPVVVTAMNPDEYSVGLAMDGAGGAFVTWVGYGDKNIYAQRIDSSGARAWASDLQIIGDGSVDDVSDPPRTTIEDGSGGFITTWYNDRDEIMVQRVNGNGSPLWHAGGVVLSNVPANTKHAPRIAGNGSGGAVVVWNQAPVSGSNRDIYLQGVDPDGNLGNPRCRQSGEGVSPVPTMNEWGMIIFSLLMAGFAGWSIRRRNQESC